MAPLIYLDTHVAAWMYAGRTDLLPAGVQSLLEEHDLLISPAVELELQYLFEVQGTAEPAAAVVAALEREVGLAVCDLPFRKGGGGAGPILDPRPLRPADRQPGGAPRASSDNQGPADPGELQPSGLGLKRRAEEGATRFAAAHGRGGSWLARRIGLPLQAGTMVTPYARNAGSLVINVRPST